MSCLFQAVTLRAGRLRWRPVWPAPASPVFNVCATSAAEPVLGARAGPWRRGADRLASRASIPPHGYRLAGAGALSMVHVHRALAHARSPFRGQPGPGNSGFQTNCKGTPWPTSRRPAEQERRRSTPHQGVGRIPQVRRGLSARGLMTANVAGYAGPLEVAPVQGRPVQPAPTS